MEKSETERLLGRVILKWIFKEIGLEGVDWIHLA
jgi:hypothetical protein